MRKIIIMSFSLLISITAVAMGKDDFTDPSKSIAVTPASRNIVLKIQSNPTTGYSWFLVYYDRDLLTPVNRTYVAPTSNLVGASGYELWNFKVSNKAFVVPQVTHITLQQIRPWAASDQDHGVTFTVIIHKNDQNQKR